MLKTLHARRGIADVGVTSPAMPAYLTGVQGLRTVAALLVAVYHIWFDRVSGGVDVFLVVAGYFAAKSLIRMQSDEGVRPRLDRAVAYWLRTARRVVPSAAVVIVGTVVASMIWAPVSMWDSYLESGLAAMTFRENWYLIAAGTDYLQQGLGVPVFQQFWALAVQVQFYVLMPLILLGALYLAESRWWRTHTRPGHPIPRRSAEPRGWRTRTRPGHPIPRRSAEPRGWRTRSTVLAVLGGTLVVSLAFSIYLTAVDQPTAYFHTLARLWEFMIGALLALLLRRGLTNRRLARALGYVGLVALISLGATVDVSASFPGAVALIPATAAVLIIVASASHADPWPLTARPVVAFGNSSFAFYLWHFPILVLVRLGFGDVGVLGGLGILALAAALAFVTTRFVEDPVRNWRRIQGSAASTILVCLALLAPAQGALTYWEYSLGSLKNDAWEVATAVQRSRDAAPVATGPAPVSVDEHTDLVPEPIILREDIGTFYDRDCFGYESEVVTCEWGNPDAQQTVAVVGGSHSQQWMDAVSEVIDEQGIDAKLVGIIKLGCVFGDIDQMPGITRGEDCHEWADAALQHLIDDPPDLVVTIGTRWANGYEQVPAGYLSHFEALAVHDIPVIAIRDNPRFGDDPVDCIEANPVGSDACAIERARIYNPDIDAQIPDLPGFTFVDIADDLCTDDACPVIDGDIPIYRDDDHLTVTWTMVEGVAVQDAVRAHFAIAAG